MWLDRFWKRKPKEVEASPAARALRERLLAVATIKQYDAWKPLLAEARALEPTVHQEVARLALAEWSAADERRAAYEKEHGSYGSEAPGYGALDLFGQVLSQALARDLPWTRQDVEDLIGWCGAQRSPWESRRIAKPLFRTLERMHLMEDATLREWARRAAELEEKFHDPDRKWVKEVRGALGEAPVLTLAEGEAWSDALTADLDAMAESLREAWFELLLHAATPGDSTPTAKWSKEAARLAERVGRAELVQRLQVWFARVEEPRTKDLDLGPYQRFPEGSLALTDVGQELLKGLCWCAAALDEPQLARALGRLALTSFRKVPGIGPRAVKVGNAALLALSRTSGPDALAQLAMLRVKVKVRVADKSLERALSAAAERSGLAREDVEELAVPSYGFTDVGARHETLGDHRAELALDVSGSTSLRFVKPDGKSAKSVPAAVKAAHAEELSELKTAAKDASAMLSAQRDRIDALFLEEKSWPFAAWRERYLDHPLTGVIARALVWQVSEGSGPSRAVFLDAETGFVGSRGEPVEVVEDAATVRLWHPIESGVDEVLAWRRFVEERGVRQPFKQAHREIYLLTDAERRTATYSNRFAAHILRQHQFNALCSARRWRNKLRMMADEDYPPATRLLPRLGLRAEYWVEGAGAVYGRDTTDSGAFLHLTTDQVRFYRTDSAENRAHGSGGGYAPARGERAAQNQPIPLDQVPPLVLSEVLRDVDLFVGVASVGNNPEWQDGGPENRFRDYWWSYGFGELSESGAGRRDLLERLLPRLAIAPACSFAERFLVVKGKLRTYKIHLGSGNILMEPTDQYLCIVPDASQLGGPTAHVHLPFEGDRTLSIILSKAFLLAADDEIEDASIRRQICG